MQYTVPGKRLALVWQKTEVGGPEVTSTANSYSLWTTQVRLGVGCACTACCGCPDPA